MIDILLGLIIVGCVVLALRETVKGKKKGSNGCDGNCDGCCQRDGSCNVTFLNKKNQQ